MKVVVSWSGEQGRAIGQVFRKWLPNVIQAVTPYFSPDDIAKGLHWENEISMELSEFGVQPVGMKGPLRQVKREVSPNGA
jgi:hypothetical protein